MRNEKMRLVTTVLISCILAIITLISCGNKAAPAERQIRVARAMSQDAIRYEELYTVQDGDTLLGIASKYIAKNTYAPRELHEFAEGIREANPRSFVIGNYVKVGEVLVIRYWERR